MKNILLFMLSLEAQISELETWTPASWAILFLMTTLAIAAGVWLGIRIYRGQRYVHQRVAMLLALVERAVQDALRELNRAEGATPYSSAHEPLRWDQLDARFFSPTPNVLESAPQNPTPFARLFINAFEQDALKLAAISDAEIASMGKSAAREYATLVRSIHSWNQLSVEEENANTLLPTILVADKAA
ncbi:MAG: hypothetical protein GY822_17305 [Deltaproteobacteria bacterium]|nr:hypothetical protein [Deltaproteobacteria bacterium]